MAKLMRLRQTSARYRAARMVLVDGKSAAEATVALATSRQNVDQAVAACVSAMYLARKAAGVAAINPLAPPRSAPR